MYVGDWMERGERYWPNALAVVDAARGEAGRFSYRALNRRANRLARWLRDEAGVGRGDRVGLVAMNGVEVLDTFFACGKLGAIFVPYNWRSHPREIAELARQTSPKALVLGDEHRESAAAIAGACPGLTRLLHTDGEGLEGSLRFEAVLQTQSDAPVQEDAVEAEDIACLLGTGGTTGLPKWARISHRMIAWNTLNVAIHEIARGDVTITHTPMFHTGGLLVYTVPLLAMGGTVVIMRKWTADEMLAIIERQRVTMLFCVPTQYQMMMQSPRFGETSFKSLRFLTSGGAPLPVPVIRAYRERHGVVFKQGFGMTEFGPGVFSLGPEHADTKAGSIGKPNFFIDARIVDDSGRALPAEEIGELVLKGPTMCSGYFGVGLDDGASAGVVDASGWFHTGDLARADEEGFYYIVGRKKDMFISGGENVYPIEIEKALYEHPAVAQCAVIGVPDPQWGEVGLCAIVPKPGAAPTEAELIEHCRARLARYKVPKRVVLTDALPLSAAGKILKRELRERYA